MPMKTRYYQVYKHTNKTNGKVYIGITSWDWQRRWKNNYNGSPHMKLAIKKYGLDGFYHEVLFEHLTKEEAQQKEIELIAEYKSNDPDFGYNLSSGGESHNGCKGMHYQTEESKAKISATHKGKVISQEVRNKMSNSHKGKHGKPTWLNTQEQIESSRQRMIGNNYYRLRKIEQTTPVISIDANGNITKYNSIKEAATAMNTSTTSIYRACSKKRKTCKGLVWEYA